MRANPEVLIGAWFGGVAFGLALLASQSNSPWWAWFLFVASLLLVALAASTPEHRGKRET